jgi:chemotaxis protein methyltransferase CheR
MIDQLCVQFLKWCLPNLRLKWSGFQKVRRHVCKRIYSRCHEIGISTLLEYQKYLENHGQEWEILDTLCRITISRFYRDRQVFETLRNQALPLLIQKAVAGGEQALYGWSLGCCNGEEAYSLQILWQLGIKPNFPEDLRLRLIATDVNAHLLERASQGCYVQSSLKDLPPEWIDQAFEQTGRQYCIKESYKENLQFVKQDIRHQLPEGRFHLILCRNLVFTYFEKSLQLAILAKLVEKLIPGGFLVIGSHEKLPGGSPDLQSSPAMPSIYQKTII